MRRKEVWATKKLHFDTPLGLSMFYHIVFRYAPFFPSSSSTPWYRLRFQTSYMDGPYQKQLASCWLNLTAKWWRVLYEDKHSDWHKKNNIWEDVHIEYPLHKQPFHMQEAFTHWMFQYHSLKVVFTMIVINSQCMRLKMNFWGIPGSKYDFVRNASNFFYSKPLT